MASEAGAEGSVGEGAMDEGAVDEDMAGELVVAGEPSDEVCTNWASCTR